MPFDIHKLIQKYGIPFSQEQFPGENHIPKHNFSGPSTRLDIRLDKNDNPKPFSKPINGVDTASYHHDLKYRDAADNLSLKHKADQEMLSELENVNSNSFREWLEKRFVQLIMKTKLKLGMGINSSKDEIDNQILAEAIVEELIETKEGKGISDEEYVKNLVNIFGNPV